MGLGRQTVGQHWLVKPQGTGVGSILTGRAGAGVVHLSQLSQTAVSPSLFMLEHRPFPTLCVLPPSCWTDLLQSSPSRPVACLRSLLMPWIVKTSKGSL